MSSRFQPGFTIVEVVLFLAISGGIAAALMGGWAISVNTQSYRDSSYSLMSKLQQQYTNATDVQNDRSAEFGCKKSDGGATAVVGPNSSNSSPRGASDCVVMGKYIYADGSKLAISSIVGMKPADDPDINTAEQDVMLAYKPAAIADSSALPAESYAIPWGSRPYGVDNSGTQRFVLALVRSPTSGTIHTYEKTWYTDTGAPSVIDLVSGGKNNQNPVNICLDPPSPVASERLLVSIAANASSQNGVTQGGGAEKC